MTEVFAHIAGIPVEETALSFGPIFLASGGLLTLRMRERAERRRERRRKPARGSGK